MYIDDRERPRRLLRGQILLRATNDTKLWRVIIIRVLKRQDTSERICLLYSINCFWNHFSLLQCIFRVLHHIFHSLLWNYRVPDNYISVPDWCTRFQTASHTLSCSFCNILTIFFSRFLFITFLRVPPFFSFYDLVHSIKNTNRCLCSLRINSVF